jgi:ribosomal protein L11 methylase PrmA
METFMARIIVTTDPRADRVAPVLLDERVSSIHLEDRHHAAQLVERVGWAISDAESMQGTPQAP